MTARIGLIGAGWWAVVNHLPVLRANQGCEVVAISRLGQLELAEVQRAFDVPFAFEDYRELLDRVPLDGVVIASPHVLHHEHALAALAHGCHVMVEKPLATTAADARAIVAAARRADRRIVVPYGWNFRPFTAQARDLLRGVGRIEHVVLQMASALEDLMAGQPMRESEGALFRPPASTWADPARAGGYGWGQLSHALGLLFATSDLVPESVFAMTGQSPAAVDYYDAAVIRFEGGATAALSGSATVPKHCGFQIDLRVFGDEGMLLLDIERERLELRRRDGRDQVVTLTPGECGYECAAPLGVFVDICRGLSPDNPASGEVGLRAVQVLDAMYRSATSGSLEAVR